MGYQESWVIAANRMQFRTLIQAYAEAEKAGFYAHSGAEPLTVLRLKKEIGGFPAGTMVLWVCGDRGFHNPWGLFGEHLPRHIKVRIMPIEAILSSPPDVRLMGIDLESTKPSENEYMIRYSVKDYADRLIGKQLGGRKKSDAERANR